MSLQKGRIPAPGLDSGYDFVLANQGGRTIALISDPSGKSIGVMAEAGSTGGDMGFDVEFESSSQGSAGTFVQGYAGLRGARSLGGVVRLTPTGRLSMGFYTVSLFYSGDVTSAEIESGSRALSPPGKLQSRLLELDEESQLRMFRLEEETGFWRPAGESDQGVNVPTYSVDDYGVQTGKDRVWSHVAALGRFTVGAPDEDDTDPDQVETMFGTITVAADFAARAVRVGCLLSQPLASYS